MSCVDKHNNSDFKFCPVCGEKLEHEAAYAAELNGMYIEYVKMSKELGFEDNHMHNFLKLQKKRGNQLKCNLFFAGNKFLSEEEAKKVFPEWSLQGLVDNNSRYFYRDTRFSSEYVLYICGYVQQSVEECISEMEKYQKMKELDECRQAFRNKYVQRDYYLSDILSKIEYVKIPKEELKDILNKFIDEGMA